MPFIPASQVKSSGGFTSVSDLIIAGQNQQVPEKTTGQNILGNVKAFAGGVASGAGGIALTAEDWAGRKLVNTFGTEQMKQNIANTPTLNEQFKTQMGGNENPIAFGGGQLVGEVATLATPVGMTGKLAKTTAETLGAGSKTAKLVQAGTEGATFTAGVGLTENKSQSLSDYAINSGLNMAFPGVGMVAKGIGENMPGRIINSLIKPLAKDFSYGKNPGKTVAELVPPANDFEGLISNIKTTLNDVGSRIGQVVSQSPNLKQIDLSYTLSPIDNAIKEASKAKGTNATLIQRLETVKQDLVDNINNGIDPQTYKGLVGDLTKWTGSVSDDQMVNKALKQVYGTTRGEMDNVLSKELTPEQFNAYKADSEAYGNLLSAKNAAEYRDKLVQRQDLISFGAKNSALLTGLTTAIATGGAGLPVLLAAGAGALLDKGMATPAFKTRLAGLLTKLAPKEVSTFFEKVPTAKSLFTEQQLKDYFGSFKGTKLNAGFVNPGEIFKINSAKISNIVKKASEEDIAILENYLNAYRNNLPTPKGITGLLKDMNINFKTKEDVATFANKIVEEWNIKAK